MPFHNSVSERRCSVTTQVALKSFQDSEYYRMVKEMLLLLKAKDFHGAIHHFTWFEERYVETLLDAVRSYKAVALICMGEYQAAEDILCDLRKKYEAGTLDETVHFDIFLNSAKIANVSGDKTLWFQYMALARQNATLPQHTALVERCIKKFYFKDGEIPGAYVHI